MRSVIISAMMTTATGMMNPPWLFYSSGRCAPSGRGADVLQQGSRPMISGARTMFLVWDAASSVWGLWGMLQMLANCGVLSQYSTLVDRSSSKPDCDFSALKLLERFVYFEQWESPHLQLTQRLQVAWCRTWYQKFPARHSRIWPRFTSFLFYCAAICRCYQNTAASLIQNLKSQHMENTGKW